MFILQVTIQIQQTFAPQEGVRSLKFVISFPLWNPLSPHTESLFLMLVHFFSRLSFWGAGGWAESMICFQEIKVYTSEIAWWGHPREELSWEMFCLPLSYSVKHHTAEAQACECVCVCVRRIVAGATYTSLSELDGELGFSRICSQSWCRFCLFCVRSPLVPLPPPRPLSGRFLVGHVKINLRENKQQSTTTNTVNCLSAFLAGRSLTAGHTGSWHHFSQPLR